MTPAVRTSTLVVLVVLVAGAALAAPTEKPVEEPALEHAVSDLGWLSGDWRGRRGEGAIEESWSEVAAGGMMGMFRAFEEGGVRFYEFMAIEPGEDGPELRIKHFSPNLVGWEAKDEAVIFDLVALEPGRRAVFAERGAPVPTRLIYLREGNHLEVVLQKHAADGPTRSVFRYQLD